MPIDGLQAHRQTILELATRHGARNVRVFGSMVRGDARPNSDIDLLVEIEPGRTLPDLIAFERLPWELTETLLDRAFESCFVSSETDD